MKKFIFYPLLHYWYEKVIFITRRCGNLVMDIERTSYKCASTICLLGNYSVTNLRLQKVLYVAQMFHLGRSGGTPLFVSDFEAWNYGPVEPELYRFVKDFGNQPISASKFQDHVTYSNQDDEFEFLKEIHDILSDKTSAQLVALTHRQNGAWAKNYRRGERGVVISKEDMLSEYKEIYQKK